MSFNAMCVHVLSARERMYADDAHRFGGMFCIVHDARAAWRAGRVGDRRVPFRPGTFAAAGRVSSFALRGGLHTDARSLACTRNAKINDFHHKMQIIRARAQRDSDGARVCVCVGVSPGAWGTHNCKYNNPSAR